MDGAPLLITITEAITWTGRPAGTLHRWASEGRITRHGTGRTALFDWYELPEKNSGKGAPPRRADHAA